MKINVALVYFVGTITLSYSDDNQNDKNTKIERQNTKTPLNPEYQELKNWPAADVKYGQAASVSFDSSLNVYLFHRGDRVWNGDTFYDNNVYKHKADGPIREDTVLVLSPNTGRLISSWGRDLFYLPHGLTIDRYDNLWITDVALHQVFKFSRLNSTAISNPLLTLGIPFTPGGSHKHFCKPTSVAILSNGDFWVSDGYCNSRLVKFNADGLFLNQIGRSTLSTGTLQPAPYHFQVPHSLALIEDMNNLCVADRENGRVQCFDCHNGTFLRSVESQTMGQRLYGVSFSHVNGGLLYVVNGPGLATPAAAIRGFVLDFASGRVLTTFSPAAQFSLPHEVVSYDNGERVFVVEIQPFRVWQFVRSDLNISVSSDEASSLLSTSVESSGALVLAVLIISAVLLVGISVLAASFVYSTVTGSGRNKRRSSRHRRGSLEQLYLEEVH